MSGVGPGLFLLVAAAGGLGAVARFVLDGAIRARVGARLPWGTIAINLTGSFLLGLVAGLAAAHLVSPQAQLVLGTGFLGGYTTFSTASMETVALVREGRIGAALGVALGTLAGGTAAAALGLAAGALV